MAQLQQQCNATGCQYSVPGQRSFRLLVLQLRLEARVEVGDRGGAEGVLDDQVLPHENQLSEASLEINLWRAVAAVAAVAAVPVYLRRFPAGTRGRRGPSRQRKC